MIIAQEVQILLKGLHTSHTIFKIFILLYFWLISFFKPIFKLVDEKLS